MKTKKFDAENKTMDENLTHKMLFDFFPSLLLLYLKRKFFCVACFIFCRLPQSISKIGSVHKRNFARDQLEGGLTRCYLLFRICHFSGLMIKFWR